MLHDDDTAVTRLEWLYLHKAIQRHCVCRTSGPAVLEEACPAHLLLRDDDAIHRWVQVRRKIETYVAAEFK